MNLSDPTRNRGTGLSLWPLYTAGTTHRTPGSRRRELSTKGRPRRGRRRHWADGFRRLRVPIGGGQCLRPRPRGGLRRLQRPPGSGCSRWAPRGGDSSGGPAGALPRSSFQPVSCHPSGRRGQGRPGRRGGAGAEGPASNPSPRPRSRAGPGLQAALLEGSRDLPLHAFSQASG